MRLADIARTLLFPLYLAVDGVATMCALTFVIGLCRSAEAPSLYTVIRANADEEIRARVNNAFGMLQSFMMVIGPVLGGALQALFGNVFVILFDASTFLVSFILLSALKDAESEVEVGNELAGNGKGPQLEAALPTPGRTLDFLRCGLPILSFLMIDVASGIAFGSLNSLIPIIAQLKFDSSSLLCGVLQSSLTVGLLLGNIVYGKMKPGFSGTREYCIASYFALGCFLALSFTYEAPVAIPLLLAVGAGNSVQDVLLITAIQDIAQSDDTSTRFFSIRESLQSIVVLASTGVVALASTAVSMGLLVMLLGIFSIILVATLHALVLREGGKR